MKSNVNRQSIVIYEELPSGGAKRLFEYIIKGLTPIYRILQTQRSSFDINISNIFEYYWYILFQIPILEKSLLKYVNDASALVVFQSWITKSPTFIRKVKIPIIYICNEAPREFYDLDYRRMFTLKEKLINFIGIIIKYIDKVNVTTAKNITIVTNSNFSAKQIYNAYGIKSKVIYPGIDVTKYGPRKKWNERKNQVISVGSLNKLKNQLYIIKCIAEIKKENRPFLVLVGNGGNDSYIDEMTNFAREKEVILLIKQNIEDYELKQLYNSSKVFIYSSINEPFGLVVLEAMASGLPIIAIRNGGFSEILTQKNGFLFNKYIPIKWANKILLFLSDKYAWEAISSHNYQYCKSFSIESMNNKIVNIINNILVKM